MIQGEAPSFNPTAIQNEILTKVTAGLTQAAQNAAWQLAAKFVPGIGSAFALLNGFQFLLSNQNSIQQIFQSFFDSLGSLADGDAIGFGLVDP